MDGGALENKYMPKVQYLNLYKAHRLHLGDCAGRLHGVLKLGRLRPSCIARSRPGELPDWDSLYACHS